MIVTNNDLFDILLIQLVSVKPLNPQESLRMLEEVVLEDIVMAILEES